MACFDFSRTVHDFLQLNESFRSARGFSRCLWGKNLHNLARLSLIYDCCDGLGSGGFCFASTINIVVLWYPVFNEVVATSLGRNNIFPVSFTFCFLFSWPFLPHFLYPPSSNSLQCSYTCSASSDLLHCNKRTVNKS